MKNLLLTLPLVLFTSFNPQQVTETYTFENDQEPIFFTGSTPWYESGVLVPKPQSTNPIEKVTVEVTFVAWTVIFATNFDPTQGCTAYAGRGRITDVFPYHYYSPGDTVIGWDKPQSYQGREVSVDLAPYPGFYDITHPSTQYRKGDSEGTTLIFESSDDKVIRKFVEGDFPTCPYSILYFRFQDRNSNSGSNCGLVSYNSKDLTHFRGEITYTYK